MEIKDFHRHVHDVKAWSEKADLCIMHDLDSQAAAAQEPPLAPHESWGWLWCKPAAQLE
ncbi:hypothetical protein [Massilia sp. 9096]|uniref:hypothetical protein n=1 Tax=Massilia sp. 9096 TaxID=1500894 RepID=UPI0012E09316|nr:hypothetical protein [Massilia sp. 9096]